jgi:hypothetical protein
MIKIDVKYQSDKYLGIKKLCFSTYGYDALGSLVPSSIYQGLTAYFSLKPIFR